MTTTAETPKRAGWMWGVLAAVVIAGVVLWYFRASRVDPRDNDRLVEKVLLRCSETGFEFSLERARMEDHLYLESNRGMLDPNKGMPNPKTGKPTCFPEDRADWTATVDRINRERQAAKNHWTGGGATTGNR